MAKHAKPFSSAAPAGSDAQRMRLDMLLLGRELAESREQARRLILAGKVEVRGLPNPKPGIRVKADALVRVLETERYVSRGGCKLEAALKSFGVSVNGLACADIGSSTGGFVDCLVQQGAARVYAVDVGRSQLHPRMRNHPRVVLIEQTNARDLVDSSFPEQVALVTVDVSFISLEKILAPIARVCQPDGQAVVLVKPQFEATPAEASRGRGVIRDPAVHARVLREVSAASIAAGWTPSGLICSPIRGGSGNREYLMHLRHMTADGEHGKCSAGRLGIDIDGAVRQGFMKPQLDEPLCDDNSQDGKNIVE